MAPLASIPESPSVPSSAGATHLIRPRRPHTSPPEKRRSRSSGHFVAGRASRKRISSRGRATLIKLSKCSASQPSAATHEKEAPRDVIKKDTSLGSSSSDNKPPDADAVSDLESSLDSIVNLSDISVSLEAFPVPPDSTFKDSAEPSTEGKLKNAPGNVGADGAQAQVDASPEQALPTDLHQPRPSESPRSRTRRYTDAVSESAYSSKESLVDSALVDAISRGIAQQLRILSLSGSRPSSRPRSGDRDGHQSDDASRTSSQRRALKRFSRELHKYADMTCARGKVPNFVPTPTSADTLRTVSALMPYRSEFKAAGLAVTSADQSPRPHRLTPASNRPRPRPGMTQAAPRPNPQVDGQAGYQASSSNNTEISFPPANEIDEWRYALVDQLPPPQRRPPEPPRGQRTRCIPCFHGGGDGTTDNEGSVSNASNYLSHGGRSPGPPRPPGAHRGHEKPTGLRSTNMLKQNIELNFGNSMPDPALRPGPRPGPPISRSHQGRPPPDPRILNGRTTGMRRPSMTLQQAQARMGPPRGGLPMPPGSYPSRMPPPRPRQQFDARQYGTYPHPHQPPPWGAPPSHVLPRRHQSVPYRRSIDAGTSRPLPLGQGRPLPRRVDSLPELTSTRKRLSGRNLALEDALVKTATEFGNKAEEARKQSTAPQDASKTDDASKSAGPVPLPDTGAPGLSITNRPEIPRRVSSIQGKPYPPQAAQEQVKMDEERKPPDPSIPDRDVLKGLHVAVSAACDDEVNMFLRDTTGLEVRRFLADLMTLEAHVRESVARSARDDDDAEQRARKRRSEIRRTKAKVRKSRDIGKMRRQDM